MDEPSLDEVYRLVKENNQMLKAMRRDAFVKGILGAVWWFFILIVLPYLSWILIQPYIKSITDAAQGVQNTKSSISSSIKGLPDINNLLQLLGGGK
jgi:hypothetical protein